MVELGLSRTTGNAGFLTALLHHIEHMFQGSQHPRDARSREGGKAGAGDLGMLSAPPVLLVSSNQKIEGHKEPGRDQKRVEVPVQIELDQQRGKAPISQP